MNERVKLIRKQLGMTQEQLAQRLGIGKAALSMIETGKREPKLTLLRAIALRLRQCLRRGDTLADAAEYFCVTEDFLRKAYALYRDMGYSFGAEEKA